MESIARPEPKGALTIEEAALRRVATLVARESPPLEIFVAVTEEASRVLECEAVGLLRFEPDETATLVAQSDTPWDPPPLGTGFPLDGENVITRVFHTHEAARDDGWAGASGTVAAMASVLGVRSAVASPVVVGGRLWGTIIAATSQAEPLPAGMESRVARFTELVATAIANAEARDAVARLAEEQAALRRVATLVAQGTGPEGVFPAVAAEVDTLFGADVAAIVRFDEDGAATVLGDVGGPHVAGTRVSLDPGYVVDLVRTTGRSSRFDSDDPTGAGMPSLVRTVGIRSAVASPIMVEGEVWGAITAASVKGPLPSAAERRLAEFTELIATAVSNTQAHEALRKAAEEQGALRRVATLVALEASREAVFNAIAESVAGVTGEELRMVRFEGDQAVVLAGSDGPHADVFAVDSRVPLGGDNALARVYRTGKTARIDDYSQATAPIAQALEPAHIRSIVATPISVEGRTWGAMVVATYDDQPPVPQETERRLREFTDFMATSIANAEARAEIARFAEQEAALRRIATLVAAEASQDEIFNAIAEGAGGALGEELRLVRFEGDQAVVLAGSDGPHVDVFPVGTRVPLGGNNALSRVFRTGRTARIDDNSAASGPIAEAVKTKGLRGIVATPVVVEGRTWGAMLVAAFGEQPVPPETEGRLRQYAELMATAIANAEARGDLSRLLEDQAALRRVATLVADQAEPGVIFASVAEEVAQAVAGERCAIGRLEDEDALTVIAYWSQEEQKVPVGASFDVGNDEVVAAVRESGRLLRIEDHEAFSGPLMDYARTLGSLPSSTIAAPVFVGGRMWGVIFTSTMAAVLPEGTDLRVMDFAELVATAIANAEARTEVERLAEQQSALRRVATLVARRDAPDLVFRTVTHEAGALLGADISALVRFETEDTVTVMAGPPPGPYAAGERVALDPDFVVYAVRETGRPARFETEDPTADGMPDLVRRLGIRSALASPILVEGDLWGAMILGSYAGSFPPETEQRLDDFSELVATGISNASARAELVASRARIVAAGDEARRRIERNLHDGTQQRLIALGLDLQGVRAGIPKDQSDSHVALEAVEEDLEAILEDLRELSHGLHPPLLSRLGLGPSLQALARRSPIPVCLEIDLPERPESSLETAMYYVVSEALTNAIKHSHASEISVTISRGAGLRASIADDGIGGADPAGGSGLSGLSDRVDALGGRFACDSPARGGTRISVELPLAL